MKKREEKAVRSGATTRTDCCNNCRNEEPTKNINTKISMKRHRRLESLASFNFEKLMVIKWNCLFFLKFELGGWIHLLVTVRNGFLASSFLLIWIEVSGRRRRRLLPFLLSGSLLLLLHTFCFWQRHEREKRREEKRRKLTKTQPTVCNQKLFTHRPIEIEIEIFSNVN